MQIVDICKGYRNPQIKIGIAKHFFEIASLESQKNAAIGIFLKKGWKDIFPLQISLEFAFIYRKVNTSL